ncbi:MAG: NAD-dependent epimerase/dehydratase family protein, partial [Deltaproteobacteria bacterium]|nr:NAD-dependent epimerase/dehydratase family protein [Deltaproteobacteria bacterium]
TNEPYAVAKIAGIKMCQAYNRQYGTKFISVMPTNLYGPNDNYHPLNSHVLPALIRRFHEAKTENKPYVEAWGTGSPRREFYYSEDMAEACIFLMKTYDGSVIVNIGCGEDMTIKELTGLVAGAVGYKGEIRWDPSKPDGTPQKLLDVSRLHALGWTKHTPLAEGLKLAYADFLENKDIRK